VTPCTDNSTCINSFQSGKCKPLNLLTVNCCSLRSTSKRALLAAMIEQNNTDIVMGCESHLDNSYFTSEVFPANFTIYCKDRCVGAGGVFVAISDNLTSLEDPIIDVSAELVWAKLSIHGMAPVYICAATKKVPELLV